MRLFFVKKHQITLEKERKSIVLNTCFLKKRILKIAVVTLKRPFFRFKKSTAAIN